MMAYVYHKLSLFGLLLVLLACVQAQSNSETGPTLPSHVNQQAFNAINKFWTADRLRHATPKEQLLPPPSVNGQNQHARITIPDGPEISVPGGYGALLPEEDTQLEIDEGTHNDTRHTRLVGSYQTNPAAYPWRITGKVFFTQAGVRYQCTASIGHSYMLWTAGHCVYDSTKGGWSTNFVFIPAYNNGAEPYGRWFAAKLSTTNEWRDRRDFSRDLGAVHVARRWINGANWAIGDYLGFHGYVVNTGYDRVSQQWTAIGYPAASPFNGMSMYYVRSNLQVQYAYHNPDTVGINSDATGGASGGPWLRNWNMISPGQVNSVNSFKFTNDASKMYGPYFDTYVSDWWNAAIRSQII